jgi:hypothetical protein
MEARVVYQEQIFEQALLDELAAGRLSPVEQRPSVSGVLGLRRLAQAL